MKPTSAPLSAVNTPPSETKFASLSGRESKGEEPAAGKGDGEQVDQAGTEGTPHTTPPDQKGGNTSSGLIDLPIASTPKIAGKYAEFLQKEYGIELSLEDGSITIDGKRIPKLSEWMESGDAKTKGGNNEKDWKARTGGQAFKRR